MYLLIFCVTIIILTVIYILGILFANLIAGEKYKNEYKAIEQNIPSYRSMENRIKPKYCIILTSTVKVSDNIIMLQTSKDERLNMYLESFNKWLKDPDFYIVIVENSGYKFEELNLDNDRHEIVSFTKDSLSKEDQTMLTNTGSKGAHEFYSINYALKNSEIIKALGPNDFIMKLTGRYYIPDFYQNLNKSIKEETEAFIQGTSSAILNLGIRCELLGCRKYISDYLFHFNIHERRVAEIIYSARINKIGNVTKLPIMEIPTTITGGFYAVCDEL